MPKDKDELPEELHPSLKRYLAWMVANGASVVVVQDFIALLKWAKRKDE